MRRFSVTICFVFCAVNLVMAQTDQDAKEEDPFKNDPFFSAPISNFFGKSSAQKDSLKNDQHVQEFVIDLNDEGLDFGGVMEAGPYNSNMLYSVYPNLPMLHFNRVNSLFLGIKKARMQWYQDDWLGIPKIQPHGLIGYSTGQREWNYTLGMEKLWGPENHVLIGAEYHDAASTNDEWRVGLNETSLTAVTAGYDYLDYYKQRGWGAYMLVRSDRYFEGGLAFSDDQFSSLQQETDWALFGAGDRYRINPPVEVQNGLPVDSVNISSLTISASFNPKKLVLSKNFTFSLTGIAEFADPGIGTSDYDYTKYTGELITYYNFEPGGVLKHRLRMSGINGDAPRFKQLYLGGVGTLRALPFKLLGGGDRMILSNLELHFGNQLGSDGWVDFEDFYFSVFLDSGWINSAPESESLNNPNSGFNDFKFSDLKHNGGVGAGSSLIRAELAWDLNKTSRAPVFWIRFNPTF